MEILENIRGKHLNSKLAVCFLLLNDDVLFYEIKNNIHRNYTLGGMCDKIARTCFSSQLWDHMYLIRIIKKYNGGFVKLYLKLLVSL